MKSGSVKIIFRFGKDRFHDEEDPLREGEDLLGHLASFIAEKIISTMKTHFFETEKIFPVSYTSLFAAEMIFSDVEKTAGALPAGLFLNYQPFHIRLAFALWRKSGQGANMALQVKPVLRFKTIANQDRWMENGRITP